VRGGNALVQGQNDHLRRNRGRILRRRRSARTGARARRGPSHLRRFRSPLHEIATRVGRGRATGDRARGIESMSGSNTRSRVTSTDAVHAGDDKQKPYDSIPTPVVQTATYAFSDTAEIEAYTQGRHPNEDRGEYGRYGNPTVRSLEKRLAALEGTE